MHFWKQTLYEDFHRHAPMWLLSAESLSGWLAIVKAPAFEGDRHGARDFVSEPTLLVILVQ